LWQRQTSQIMDLKKVCADKYLLQQQLKWLKDNKKKNSSIKPSVMVSATPYNFFTSLPFINEDGKTPKDVFSQQKIITASLKSEQFTKKQNNIILFWVIFINSYIISSYIYQLLYYIELYLSTLNVNWNIVFIYMSI